MATIIKKKKKNQYYYYLVQSARVNGKPRIVSQQYLGRAEDIGKAMGGRSDLDTPKHSFVFEFGSVCALYNLADQLDVVGIIDKYAPKRNQGLSIGEYMLLAAINRAVKPTSKVQIGDWYQKTMLSRISHVPKHLLSSQRFWDNMNLLSEESIHKFEDEFSELITRKFGLHNECLIYDTTNFFTYVDTMSASKLPQRGHSKEKRFDLKIVGLAMMVSPDFNIPLFHEVYPGNDPDAKEFGAVVERLKARFMKLVSDPKNVTLVFDKGNNSPGNMELIMDGKRTFKVVGTLKLSQCKPLLDVPKDSYSPVPGYKSTSVTAHRETFIVYGRGMTVLVVHNPELLRGQMQGITSNIEKCTIKLTEFQRTLNDSKRKKSKGGYKHTKASVEKRVKGILTGEYMKELFPTNISVEDKYISLNFALNVNQLEYIQERYLGKTIIFTDNHDWPNERIISAYRSQYHIEHAFRQMKDSTYLGFRPIYHWTDQKIKVHAFYCVLALRLCSLLNRILDEHGIHLSIDKMLSTLSEIKQVITVYPKRGESKKDRESFSLTKVGSQERRIMEILGIKKYALGG